MSIDALLRRYFPAVVLVLLGMAAYFQASGLGWVVTSAAAPTAPEPSARPPSPARKPVLAATSTDHTTSGQAILSRNPFDSVTGPRDKPKAAEPEPQPVESTEDPTELPFCDSGRVLLITWSESPEWSFASIAGSGGKSTLRRAGDEVDGYK